MIPQFLAQSLTMTSFTFLVYEVVFSHESTGLVNCILVSPYNVVLCVFGVPQSL